MDDFLLDSEEYKQYVESAIKQLKQLQESDNLVKQGLVCQVCAKPRSADGTGAIIRNNRPDGDNTRYHCLPCYAQAFKLAMDYAKILQDIEKNKEEEQPEPVKRRRTVTI